MVDEEINHNTKYIMLGYLPLDFLFWRNEPWQYTEWLNIDHFIGCTQTHVIEQ